MGDCFVSLPQPQVLELLESSTQTIDEEVGALKSKLESVQEEMGELKKRDKEEKNAAANVVI